MKIQIEDNLYLESDSMQFILKEYNSKVVEDKENGSEKVVETIKNHGYFPSVQAALDKFLKMKIMDSTAKDLKELIYDVKQTREYIKKQINF